MSAEPQLTTRPDGTRVWTVLLPERPTRAEPERETPPPTRTDVDYTRSCAYLARGSHKRTHRCDAFAVVGSRYCAAHHRQMIG